MDAGGMSVPVSYFIAGLTVIGAIAGAVVWLFATFITRAEAQKMEAAVDKLILVFKELFDEKFNEIRQRLDKLDRR